MSNTHPSAYVTLFEDFLVDNVSESGALSNLLETIASSAVQDINQSSANGGWWRQEMAGDDADDLLIAGEVVWEVDEGQPLTFETRVKPSTISEQSLVAGMSDANTESSAVNPIDSDAGTLAQTATDGAFFLLDESAGGTLDTTWSGVGVSNGNLRTGAGALATQANAALTNSAPAVAGTIQVLRMVLTPADNGTIRFYVGKADEMGGGSLFGTTTSGFRSSIALCPILGADDRNVNTDVDWDYIYVNSPR